ncbi:hypothetical protein [Sphingomonas sp. PB4P5]|uniref:hypothetical protein n=1 Tax=Parasphingomonas puruogangriensis TaxID=3096155 RepID=UPI002FC9EE7B
MDEINAGDLVMLRSGSQQMTVGSTDGYNNGKATVIWEDKNGAILERDISRAALIKIVGE